MKRGAQERRRIHENKNEFCCSKCKMWF